jgi:hypothetical protein
MPWLEKALVRLASADGWPYHNGGPAAAEPTALAALALTAHGRDAAAERAIAWLTRAQAADGTVGVTEEQNSPCWPTALAVLAWLAWEESHQATRHRGCIQRAIQWTLAARGDTSPRSPLIGHDTTLTGWPWVIGTHSWLEPTAWFVLALKAAGLGEHPRTREAVRLLVDRLLPSGGCNYGNTVVMGQELLPHVQPTGLVLLALAGESISDPRFGRSVDYLETNLQARLGPASLAFAVVGLTAHRRRPANWEALFQQVPQHQSLVGVRPYTDALIALAALQQDENPLTGGQSAPLARRKSGEILGERARVSQRPVTTRVGLRSGTSLGGSP